MRTNRTKLFAIILFVLALTLLTIFKVAPTKVAASNADDPAVTFKAKCAACHTPTASKFFDPAKPDAEHVQSILKGKKGEKPPFMPGFEAKGMTPEEAQELVRYIRVLRTPAS